MKKNVLISGVCFLFTLAGCIKNTGTTPCTSKTPQSEQAAIVAYAQANSINAVPLGSTGLYYEIIAEGAGPVPNLNSVVYAKYTGKLLDGTVFDSQTVTPVAFSLSRVIIGWQLGLQQIKKGGKIKLIIPSSQGYGCDGYLSVPPDAILYFDVEITDVQ